MELQFSHDTHCIVVHNPRLDFRDSFRVVSKFIRERLASFGIRSLFFVQNREEAEIQFQRISQSSSGYIVLCDIMNPFLDTELVAKMISRLSVCETAFCIADGAIPGTQPEIVAKTGSSHIFSFQKISDGTLPHIKHRWDTQDVYNNQFNLYKYKRLKMFLGLVASEPGLHTFSIPKLCSSLKEDRVFNRLITYFEGGKLIELDHCPYCGGDRAPLTSKMSQPFCGYLTPSRPYYFECQQCGLVFLSPVLADDSLYRLYDVYDKQDFVQSLNNPYDVHSPRCDFSSFAALLPVGVRSLDLGGGIGKFSQFLKSQYPQWDVTHSDFEIKADHCLSEDGISVRALNFIEEEIGSSEYDLITAWEVIEHIPMSRFPVILSKIHRALKPGGIFLFSTPDFGSPLCQAYDFFSACPPFHYTVFSTEWLTRYFSKRPEWHMMSPRYNSDFLDDALNWYEYGIKTSPSFQLRGLSRVLKSIFSCDRSSEIKEHLLKNNIGTEVIITLQKR